MTETTTSTALRIGTAANGQRTVAVSTSTTVRTGPAFREQLDRACRPASSAPRPDAATPVATGPSAASQAPMQAASTPASQSPGCASELCGQLAEMIRQLMEALEQQGLRGARGRHEIDRTSHNPRSPAPARTPTMSPTSTTGSPSATQPAAQAPHCAAQRRFDVKPADGSHAAPTRQLVVRGGIAGAPVTTGEKLDEGVRRIASFLDQVGRHLQSGGTFTDAQLQSIADEATGIYYEAIRPTLGEGDGGDYSSPGRDGVLDLGASTRSIIVQATVQAAQPAATDPTNAAPVDAAAPDDDAILPIVA